MQQRGPYKIISSDEVYKNPWIKVREDKIIRPDGKEGIFGVVEMKSGVTVLALNENEEVYLIREYKYGIERETFELMSGGTDGKESALETARRELKEETGLEAREWIDLGVIDPFTTVVNSPNYMFLAQKLLAGKDYSDGGEVLEIIKKPFEEVVQMVMDSEITHGASCVCILKAYKYLKQK